MDNFRQHNAQCIEDATAFNTERWDKTHKEPELKVGDLVLTSPVRFNKITCPNGIRKSFFGTFVVEFIHSDNYVTAMLTEGYSRKNSTSPVIILQPYHKLEKIEIIHSTIRFTIKE